MSQTESASSTKPCCFMKFLTVGEIISSYWMKERRKRALLHLSANSFRGTASLSRTVGPRVQLVLKLSRRGGISRYARITCQNNSRLIPNERECASPGRMMNCRSGMTSFV